MIGKWVIVDKNKLEHIHTEAWEARDMVFWFLMGEEWLDAEDVITEVATKLDVALKELDKILYKKRERQTNKK
jgi:predicted nuclease of restriction endonuclease-like RecB superfamily